MVAYSVDDPLPQLLVHECRYALGQLGALARAPFAGPVIAITGSSGKTSVKEMLAAILRERGSVLATQGNLNNELGVPLTLLALWLRSRVATNVTTPTESLCFPRRRTQVGPRTLCYQQTL